jgi:hypothetical protein
MAAPRRTPVTSHDLQGFKYFRLLGPLLDHLHAAGTERDRAGNRQLFYDQYATLLLLYFFSPIVTSLRGLQQTTTLATVQPPLRGPSDVLGGAERSGAGVRCRVAASRHSGVGPPPAAPGCADGSGSAAGPDGCGWQPFARVAQDGLGAVAR